MMLAPRLVPTLACATLLAACSSSSTTTKSNDAGFQHDAGGSQKDSGGTRDAGGSKDSGGAKDSGAQKDSMTGADTGGGTMTIAAARQSNAKGSITVKGFVTALSGVPMDYPDWYIEDPAGGPYSGLEVYCDPKANTPCNVPAPALHDLIEVTGSLNSFMGGLEFDPTAMTVIQSNATPPPVPMVMATDIAASGDSQYRYVYVNLVIGSKLVVDDVTPAPLADTACGAVIPTTDAGAADAAAPACTNLCQPPLYAGFRANDGADEVYIEAPFFNTDPLQSSPECLGQPGVVPVKVGDAFTKMSGVLIYDVYASAQALAPVQPSDYALAP